MKCTIWARVDVKWYSLMKLSMSSRDFKSGDTGAGLGGVLDRKDDEDDALEELVTDEVPANEG
jgi:hypothetical protein